jgi:hypothetical protein
MEAKLNITSGMQTLISELYICESFEILSENDSLWLATENARLIKFEADSITLNGLCLIKSVDSYELNIKLFNGDNKTVIDGKLIEQTIFNETQFIIPSFEIKKLDLAVTYNGNVYKMDYYQPEISAKRFTNIY